MSKFQSVEKDKRNNESTISTEEMPNAPEIPAPHPESREEDRAPDSILKKIPARFRRSGEQLLKMFTDHNDIFQYTDNNEVKFKGHVLPGSNFDDLFLFLFDTKGKSRPQGHEEFVKIVKELDPPTKFINNPSVQKYLFKEESLGLRKNPKKKEPHSPSIKMSKTKKSEHSGEGMREGPPGKRIRVLKIYNL
jgi:DNA topoisomerase VI subunit B